MSKLTDALAEQVSADARRVKQSHPKGFEPGVKFDPDSGLPEEAVISSSEQISAEDHRKRIEEKTKLNIPENLDVVLERLTLQDNVDGLAIRWWYKYKFVEKTKAKLNDIDAASILKSLRKNRSSVTPKYASGEATMGLVWSDWQIGKDEGGGTPAFLERLDYAFVQAENRAKELAKINRGLTDLVIFGNGDLVEGCSIFTNQPWTLDCDTRTQMNTGVTAVLEGLDRLAPLFNKVTVVAVGGNHGENRQGGRRVNTHDNRDVEMFEHAARAASRDARLEHVNFILAQSELAKTVNIHDWIFAITHGQVFDRGSGSIEQKAYRWYLGQAGGRLPAGDADVLITSHFHHLELKDHGACLWVQSPTMDGGSYHFSSGTGQWAEPGMLSFVVTPEKRFQDLQVF